MSAPVVSVVIVAWNGRALLEECLTRVFTCPADPSFEVIVVDNDSGDGAPEMVERQFPEARLLRTGANLGFAAGNNRGFAVARGAFVLALNPDAFVTDPATFARLVGFLRENPGHAAVGCQLTYRDGRRQVGDAGHAPTPWTVLAHGFGLQRLAGVRSLFLSGPPGTEPVEVDWISGALLMARRSALLDVGGFDERFFMYAEDVDLGCRLRDAGWRLAYLPDISAVHVQGGTQGGPAAASTPSTRWLDALAGLYARRNPGRFAAFRIGLGLGFGLRAAAYAAMSVVTGRGRGDARAMAAFARRVWLMPEPEEAPR